MNKLLKYLAYTVLGIAVLLVIFVIYFNSTYPAVDPAPDIEVVSTPERIARGEYLANHVTVCMDCHSTRDWNKYSGPIVDGTHGKGGEVFNEEMGIPGELYSSNISPSGIGDYTDGELMRVITCGVTNDGRALFPLMPYLSYNNISEEDLYSLVAYIRSLQPIENEVPGSSLNFPLNFIVKTIPPKSYKPKAQVDRGNHLEYGKYLTTIAACADCHTPTDKGELLTHLIFAGGMNFQFPAGTVTSSNITPDKETGIGNWSKEMFIQRFRNFDPDSNSTAQVDIQKEFNTPMPWTMYAGMNDEDLGAIYDFLMTQKPINRRISIFTPR